MGIPYIFVGECHRRVLVVPNLAARRRGDGGDVMAQDGPVPLHPIDFVQFHSSARFLSQFDITSSPFMRKIVMNILLFFPNYARFQV